jgi:hypothetical protein
LDQGPNLADWSALCQTANIIVIGYLLPCGNHETKNIPEIMGFSPISAKERFIENHYIGPIYTAGKQLWLCSLIRIDPIIKEVVLEHIMEIYQT